MHQQTVNPYILGPTWVNTEKPNLGIYFEKDFSFRVPAPICRQESKCLTAMNAMLLRAVFTEEAGVVGSRPFKNAVARPRHVAAPPSLACKFPKCRKRQRRMNTLSLRPPPPLRPACHAPRHALHLTLGEFLARGKNLPLSLSRSSSRDNDK